jgi:signal transduction histidine kinase
MSCLAIVRCLRALSAPGRRGCLALLLGLISVEPTQGAATASGTTTASYEVRDLRHTILRAEDGKANDFASIEHAVDGYPWLATPSGLFRYDGAGFETELNSRLPSPSVSALCTPDGRLWFSCGAGVCWIDPSRIPRNPQIHYTAVSLTDPEQMRFCYSLLGVDEGWQDAQQRRHAYHMNLSSGRYESQVMAANETGAGSTAGAVLQFNVSPTLYRVLSFKIAVGVALILVVALWFVVRSDQMKGRYRRGMEARHAERKRIARDIHDTLLQGVQALLFRLQIWEEDPSIPESLRREIAAVSHQTRSIVLEGRERILGMRSTDTQQPVDLIESLALIGGNASVGKPTFEINTIGEVRSLTGDAQEQLIDIAREGVRNAYQHAEASRISVNVEYHKRSLHVSIADDGHGFDRAVAEGRVKSAHFGLMGMRERARQLGAQFHIRSKSKIGTRIEVIVPARAAYGGDFKWPWRRRPEAGGRPFKDCQPEKR